MIIETFTAEQTRRLLWSHAARQVLATLPQMSEYDSVPVGCGWGLRHRQLEGDTLVLHPSSNRRELGDLALTVLGHTHTIPRCGMGYVEYLDHVAAFVGAALRANHSNHLHP